MNKTFETLTEDVIRLLAEDAIHAAIMDYKKLNPSAAEKDPEGVIMMGIYNAICKAVNTRHHCDSRNACLPATTWASMIAHGEKTLKDMDDFLGHIFYGDGFPWKDNED